MKRDKKNSYTSPTISFSTLNLEGFLCASPQTYNPYVDEDENQGETEIDIIHLP